MMLLVTGQAEPHKGMAFWEVGHAVSNKLGHADGGMVGLEGNCGHTAVFALA